MAVLTEADKAFAQATLDLRWPRERAALIKAYRAAHPEAAGLTDRQIANAIKRLPSDLVADARAEAGELAAAVRRDFIRRRTAASFNEQESLQRIRQALLEEVEDALNTPIGAGMTAAAKQKWADLGHKITVSARPGLSISPEVLKAAVEQRKELEAERARLLAKQAAAKQAASAGNEKHVAEQPALYVGKSDGRA